MKLPAVKGQVLLAVLAFIAVLTLALRWEHTGARLFSASGDIVLLDNAMSAGLGETVTMAELARLGATYELADGVSARALARLALLSGQPAVAERWLKAGVGSEREPDLTLFELCRFYFAQGRMQEALAACANSRSSAVYWLNRGNEAADAHQTIEAINRFAMAAATDPEFPEAWHQLGRAYFADGRYEDAIQAMRQQLAVDTDPTVSVYRTLGESYLQLGQPLAAWEILRQGVAAFPDDRFLGVMFATALAEAGDVAQASSAYERLSKQYPDDATIWAGRSKVAQAEGDAVAAVDYLREAVRLDPDNVGYLTELVVAATVAGDTAAIEAAYRDLMRLRPDDVALWLNAGRFWLETGKLEEARLVLDRVMQLEPGNEEAGQLRQTLSEGAATAEDSAAQQP